MNRQESYQAEIDGLRAFAVLIVIAFHIDKSLIPNGFLGVDLFFVISGYVVSLSLDSRLHPSQPSGLLNFYARRVKRLFPALITCVVFTSLLGAMVIQRPKESLLTGCRALFGFSNLDLWFNGKDYFAAGQQFNLFTHTWSLGVEEQFYLVFPLILFGVKVFGFSLRNTIGALIIFSLLAYLLVIPYDPEAAFYLMPLRMWELGSGVMVYALKRDRCVVVTNRLRSILAPLSLIISLGLIPFLPISSMGLLTMLSTLFFMVSLYFLDIPGPGRSVLRLPWIVYLGKLSYSLYLWHWSILTLALHRFGKQGPVVWIVLAIAILSVSSYHFIERPLRRIEWFKDERTKSLKVVGLGLALSVTFASLLTFLPTNMYLGDPAYLDRRIFLKRSPCHLPSGPDPIGDCLTPKGEGPIIYLMGDSHAGNLLIGVRNAAVSMGYRFSHLTDRALGKDLLGIQGCGGTSCSEDEVGARLKFLSQSMKKGDILLYAMGRDRIYKDKFDMEQPRRPEPERLKALEINLTRFAQGVINLDGIFIVVEDIPKVCSKIVYKTAPFNKQSCKIKVSVSLADRKPLSNLYKRVSLLAPGMLVTDPHDLFCPNGECSNFLNGELIYADSSPHLTKEASAMTQSLIEGAIIKAEIRNSISRE